MPDALIGAFWVHLRLCMTCGREGGWCYVDEVMLDASDWPAHGCVAHGV